MMQRWTKYIPCSRDALGEDRHTSKSFERFLSVFYFGLLWEHVVRPLPYSGKEVVRGGLQR